MANTPINPFAPPNPTQAGAQPQTSAGDSFLRAGLIVAAIGGGFWLLSRISDKQHEEERLLRKIQEYEEAEAEAEAAGGGGGAQPPGVVIVMPPGGHR